MNQLEREIQHEKECRQLWIAVFSGCCSDTRVNSVAVEVATDWADRAVAAYRLRFAPNL